MTASDTPGDLDVVGASTCESFNANAAKFAKPKIQLRKGQAMRITTGAPIPSGANAVVQVEDTQLLKEADNVIGVIFMHK